MMMSFSVWRFDLSGLGASSTLMDGLSFDRVLLAGGSTFALVVFLGDCCTIEVLF